MERKNNGHWVVCPLCGWSEEADHPPVWEGDGEPCCWPKSSESAEGKEKEEAKARELSEQKTREELKAQFRKDYSQPVDSNNHDCD